MRKKIVAGNWKMNKTWDEAAAFLTELNVGLNAVNTDVEIVVFPPFPYLRLAQELAGQSVKIGAQDVSSNSFGAYTGEVAAEMIKSSGASYVLVGHSERRQYFNESHALLRAKLLKSLECGLKVIYCCGESLDERESGVHFQVIQKQIEEVLFQMDERQFEGIHIAYEPVWAIGTGKTASTEQAQEIHAYIRKLIAEEFGHTAAENTSILYGGSCNPKNAEQLFKEKDIDGGLIGGASLQSDQFIQIIQS